MSDPEPRSERELPPALAALLEAVLAGDRTTDDPEVRAAMAEPAFATAVRALSEVRDALAEFGTDSRKSTAGAVTATDRGLVAAALNRVPTSRRRWPFGKAVLALAAALLLAVVAWMLWHRQPPPDPQQLGPGDLSLVAPEAGARLSAGATVTWAGPALRPDERYLVEILAPGSGQVVWRSDLLAGSPFRVGADVLATWPQAFQFRLSVVTMDEMPTGHRVTRTYRR